MQGGLNNGTQQGSVYATATSVDPNDQQPSQPVTDRQALEFSGVSLTMEELLAIAVLVNALVGLGTLYLEVQD
jgi:hypothetical protein